MNVTALHFPDPVQPIANVEMEGVLIAAMLLDNRQIDAVADIVAAEDFWDPLFKSVFEAAVHERSIGNAVNSFTLRRPFGDEAGKALAELTGSNVSILGAKDFAQGIHELGRKRRLVSALEVIAADGRRIGTGETEQTANDLLAAAEEAIASVSDTEAAKSQRSAAEAVSRLLDNMRQREAGITSGITPIDAGLGPLLPKQLIILAGRPGMGKSAVASSYALGAAASGHGTLFVSLEMSEEELSERIVSDLCFDSDTQVPYDAITSRHLSNEQCRSAARAAERLKSLPLEIADLSSVSLPRLGGIIRRTSRRMAAKGKKLELVIVDYLQLVRSGQRGQDRYEEVSEVSRGLKALAKENGVALMALAQLSRKVEERQDKAPTLHDLRDSGQIEQDADSIMFLLRPEYYLSASEPEISDPKRPKWEGLMDDARGKIDFIIAKRRRGSTGKASGRFYGAHQAVRP